jgi:glycogen operon protein
MTDEEWHDARLSTIGLILSGDAIEELDPQGQPIVGDTLLILLNADPESTEFTLPATHNGEPTIWEIMVDTHEPDTAAQIRPGRFVTSGTPCQMGSRSLVLARKVTAEDATGDEANVE